MGFEAHKNEALLSETKDQDKQNIETQFVKLQQELDVKKEEFQTQIQHETNAIVSDFKKQENDYLNDLEKY